MDENKPKNGLRTKLRKRLTSHFKFILFDEALFHEVFSIRLRPINIFIMMSVITISLISGTILLVRYTSLSTYVVSDDVPALRRQTAQLLSQVSELELKLDQNEQYLAVVRSALSGEIPVAEIETKINIDSLTKKAKQNLSPSSLDSTFRSTVEQQYATSMQSNVDGVRDILSLSSPIKGAIISSPFGSQSQQWIGLSAKPNTPVFSIYQGTIIYKGWTPASGNVLVIEHSDGLISTYKNLGLVPKSIGESLYQGELIAMTPSSGDPSLRFELWINGKAVNPEDYINFGL